MLIDWFTVGAQVVNFLILAWLLKRFLYHPILDAIDAREKRIATELANAAKQQASATEERENFEQRNSELDRNKATLLKEATEAAHVERQRLLDEARQAASALIAKGKASLQSEAHALHHDIRQRTSQEVFAIAGKALTDLAGITLEARMVDVFVAHLRDLNDTDKAALSKALKTSGQPLVVSSTFALSDEQRNLLETTIQPLQDKAPALRYETVPELVCGIELRAEGYKVDWSIAEYLVSLEKSIGELLKPASTSEGTANAS